MVGGTFRSDRSNIGAMVNRQALRRCNLFGHIDSLYPEEWINYLAIFDEDGRDLFHRVRRNREEETLRYFTRLCLVYAKGVDTDHFAAEIEERPAGIAWIDRSIVLNQVRIVRVLH